jgi:hypothetical protein
MEPVIGFGEAALGHRWCRLAELEYEAGGASTSGGLFQDQRPAM